MASEKESGEPKDGGEGQSEQPAGRRRGLTSLTLAWFAEQFRRAEELKKAISEGKYRVDSQSVAKAVLGEQDPPRS